uniref:Uncharacterized protein n=1 Tax=Timema monikensis TaxID=170555 RepID=A0A7R9E2V1_9NEOP|nr:unnamed protein product [Timema monikensis]
MAAKRVRVNGWRHGDAEQELSEMGAAIVKGIEEGWVSPVVAREYKLEEAAQAHHDIIHNTGTLGKLVFKL